MLGFWVRLGEELGAVYGLEPVLVSREEEEEVAAGFCSNPNWNQAYY